MIIRNIGAPCKETEFGLKGRGEDEMSGATEKKYNNMSGVMILIVVDKKKCRGY